MSDFLYREEGAPGEKKPFHVMAKPAGAVCNLNCSYCYYLEKKSLYRKNDGMPLNYRMGDELLESFIRSYIESQPGDRIDFTWQGGEPTLNGLDYFKKIVAFQKKYSYGRHITNSLQTNGTLINEEWAEFLALHNFLVGISVDGPPELHDHFRKTTQGGGSFKRVMESIKLFHRFGVPFNTLTVINDRNSRMPLKVYRFLKDIGSDYMQFIPIVERESEDPAAQLRLVHHTFSGEAALTDESVEPLEFGRFLARIFDEWVRLDVGRHFVNYFDNTLAAYAGGYPSLCTMSPVCGTALIMEFNGDVYACDHFVYPAYLRGNLRDKSLGEMAGDPAQHAFGMAKREQLPPECLACRFLRACGGDCPKHRFVETADGGRISYLHDGFMYFFSHVEKEMEFMAGELLNNRPPAGIMDRYSEQEKKKYRERSRYRL